MRTYYLALDLKDDPLMIKEYKAHHEKIWPEIESSIKNCGIEKMEIYNIGNRLFMIILANDSFSFERKYELDKNNTKVQEWETLMWKYQKALPSAKKGEKWLLMKKIFEI
jgi:L-rhamnose mutarotase